MAETRGDRTREVILDVAERLFADGGVYSTSLRTIQIESGARNTAAVYYHFRDRDGLIHALAERHVTRIAKRQQELWKALYEKSRSPDARELVSVLVRPCAEYVNLGASERVWVKIMSELGSGPEVRWHDIAGITPKEAVEVRDALMRIMRAVVPPRIARERMFVAARMTVNVCADRARRIEAPAERGRPLPPKLFVNNLTNMVAGALLAPTVADAKGVAPTR